MHKNYRAKTPRMKENEIGKIIVNAAIASHHTLGPDLLESVYEVVQSHKLKKRGLQVEYQVPISIQCDSIKFDDCADINAEGKVILELKSVEHETMAHRKKILNYLRRTGCKLRFMLNFGETLMKGGITRAVNILEED